MRDLGRLCPGCMNEWGNPESPCPVCGFIEKDYKGQERSLPLRHILNEKYMLGKVLGEGGFGITYIAWDINLEIRVAVKEYFPMNLATRETGGGKNFSVVPLTGARRANYSTGLEKFMDEARNLSKFYGLPGIVAAKDFFFENNTAYMVMDYVDGITLGKYLREHTGRISEQEVLSLFKPVMESLRTVHATGLIHRDISPDNIMMTTSGQIKLIDFGAARAVGGETQKNMTIILKHGYAPAEQYQSQGNQGPWTDVYALCATMYRMLTGQVPPDAMDRLDTDTIKSFSELGCQVSNRTSRAIIDHGLALRVENRYKNMDELINGLYGNNTTHTSQHISTSNTAVPVTPVTPVTSAPSSDQGPWKKIALIAGITAAVLVIVLVIVLVAGSGGSSGTSGETVAEVTTETTTDNGSVSIYVDPEVLAAKRSEVQEAYGKFRAEGSHLVMLTDDGKVQSDGMNEQGELDVTEWENISYISTGTTNTVGITNSGTAVLAGDTSNGNSVDNNKWQNLVKVATGNNFTVGLQDDGKVIATGNNESGQCNTSSWSDIVDIAAGSSHTLGLTQDGKILKAGSNSNNQCNVGSWENVAAVYARGKVSAAVTTDGRVLLAGAIKDGMDAAMKWRNIVEVALGDGFIAGLSYDGTVLVAGNTLFDASTVSKWKNIVTITAGDETLFALKKNGKYEKTQIEYGNAREKDFKNLKKVVSGGGYLLGLKTNGKVIAWGTSGADFGLAGVSEWSDIIDIAACSTGAMGLKSDGTVVVIGEEFKEAEGWSNIKEISMGEGTALGLISRSEEGKSDEFEQVGEQKKKNKIDSWDRALLANINWEHFPQLNEDGTVTVSGSGSYAETQSWRNITMVAAGESHTVGLREDGTVVSVGSNYNGQRDVDTWSNIKYISASDYYTLGIDSNGSLLIAGTLPGNWQ